MNAQVMARYPIARRSVKPMRGLGQAAVGDVDPDRQ